MKLQCVNYKYERETELADAQVRSNVREKEKRLSKKNGGVTSGKTTSDGKKTVGTQRSTRQRGGRMDRQLEEEPEDDSESEDDYSSD